MMRFGVTFFFTDQSMHPAELAREVEARGFDSLYVAEHTHIPVSRRTPPPMGEPLPDYYKRLLDPFVALTAAASATSTLRLGTAVLLVAQRDPIITAKAIASLDHLSGGRFVLGAGFGWNQDEIEHHGVPYKERRDIARDNMLAMQALWSSDVAAYPGKFTESWQWPKPALARKRPLTLIGGGAGPILFRHIAGYADGWMPIGGRGVAAALPALRQAYEDAGRDPSSIEVVPVGTEPTPGKLERFSEIGVTEVVLGLPAPDRDTALRTLDAHAKTITPFR